MSGYGRDAAVVAGLRKLRFFPQSVTGGKGRGFARTTGASRSTSRVLGRGEPRLGHPAPVADPAGASVLSSANAPATALAELESRLAEVGPETVDACFVEPIQSDGGLIVPPPGSWRRSARATAS